MLPTGSVRVGLRRARLEGQHIGRNPPVLDNAASKKTASMAVVSERSPEVIGSQRSPCSVCCQCRWYRRKFWKHSIKEPDLTFIAL